MRVFEINLFDLKNDWLERQSFNFQLTRKQTFDF